MEEHGMIDNDEFMALGRISAAMLAYRQHADAELRRWTFNLAALPPHHRRAIPDSARKLEQAQAAVERNAALLRDIVQDGEDLRVIGPAVQAAKAHVESNGPAVSNVDVGKVRYVLKNLMRDWSAEGAREREQSFGWLVEAARRYVPPAGASSTSDPPAVLVPGAGLARLPVELAGAGYRAVANEFSFYMLLTSSYILNGVHERESIELHPWALSTSNQRSNAQQMRAVQIPDRTPAEILNGSGGQIGVIAGDFVDVFSEAAHSELYDAVATCFFIDTAHNIVAYLEVIYAILKRGGYWFNVGPLLYHWAAAEDASSQNDASIELSLEDVKHVAKELGFDMIEEAEGTALYLGNEAALFETSYTVAKRNVTLIIVQMHSIIGAGSVHNVGRFNASRNKGRRNEDRTEARCQRCGAEGHWTYECKSERPYKPRPSHTELLRGGKQKAVVAQPTVALPKELQPGFLENQQEARLKAIREAAKKRKRKRLAKLRRQYESSSSGSSSRSGSSSSSSGDSSGSDSGSGSSSSSGSSDSRSSSGRSSGSSESDSADSGRRPGRTGAAARRSASVERPPKSNDAPGGRAQYWARPNVRAARGGAGTSQRGTERQYSPAEHDADKRDRRRAVTERAEERPGAAQEDEQGAPARPDDGHSRRASSTSAQRAVGASRERSRERAVDVGSARGRGQHRDFSGRAASPSFMRRNGHKGRDSRERDQQREGRARGDRDVDATSRVRGRAGQSGNSEKDKGRSTAGAVRPRVASRVTVKGKLRE